MAVHGVIMIDSNDGNTQLATFNTMYMESTYDMVIRENGIDFSGVRTTDNMVIPTVSWNYEGSGKFLGLSETMNATAPDEGCSVGSTIKFKGLDDAYYYIVEGVASNDKVVVTYNESTIAELEPGQTAKLSCKNTQMESDLTVVVPQDAEDSPLPVEVLTEAEMDELLVTSDVGSVFKYVGTGSVYENGALYVVEEEEVKTYSLLASGTGATGLIGYYTPDEVPTNDYYNQEGAIFLSYSSNATIENIKNFVYIYYGFDFNASRSTFTNCTYELFSDINAVKVTITGDNPSCSIWVDD